MTFLTSAVHNVLVYKANPGNFEYDFKVIGVAGGLFFFLGLVLSIVYGALFGCLGLNCKVMHIVCIYGYSMSNYIICTLLCIIDIRLLTWILLLYAATAKVVFILKNMFDKLNVPTSKKIMVLVLVIAEAAVQFLAIKFALIVHHDSIQSITQVTTGHQLYLRTHEGMI